MKITARHVKDIAILGLFSALTALATLSVRIPTVASQGYVHPGDIMVILSGLCLGWARGAIAGGLGSTLADLLGGYLLFIPATLVAKSLEGGIAGLLGRDLNRGKTLILAACGGILGAFAMACAYFLYERFLLGLPAASAEFVPNLFQGAVGIAGSLFLWPALRRIFPRICGEEVRMISKER